MEDYKIIFPITLGLFAAVLICTLLITIPALTRIANALEVLAGIK